MKLIQILNDNTFEIMLLTGLSGIFYGLYLEKPYLAFLITGILLVFLGVGGVLMSKKGEQ